MNEVKRLKKFQKSSKLVTQKTDTGKMNSICSERTQVVANNQMGKTKTTVRTLKKTALTGIPENHRYGGVSRKLVKTRCASNGKALVKQYDLKVPFKHEVHISKTPPFQA